MNKQRIGKIVVSCALIHEIGEEGLKRTLIGVTIIESRYNALIDANEYICTYEMFEEVEMIDGKAIPQYDVIVTQTNGIIDKVEYKKL